SGSLIDTILKSPVTSDRPSRARCLSIHASYRCQHSGACCTAGWHIPAEPPVADAITRRFGKASGSLIAVEDVSNASAILATTQGGACVFFDADHGRLCRV